MVKKLVILTVLILTLGAVMLLHGDAHQPAVQTTSGVTAGRYQIVFGNFARADVYLLDTQTGKIWERTEFVDVAQKPEVWVFQERIDNKEALYEWVTSHAPEAHQEVKPASQSVIIPVQDTVTPSVELKPASAPSSVINLLSTPAPGTKPTLLKPKEKKLEYKR
jgi:hypothetical protein